MILYADTSALVKKYIDETGSLQARAYFLEAEHVVTSLLSELEIISMMERAKRTRRIDSPSHRRLSSMIEKDFKNEEVSLINMTPEVMSLAKQMIRHRKLRSPDAIQLATALLVQKKYGSRIFFFCFDHDLLNAASLEGLSCLSTESLSD